MSLSAWADKTLMTTLSVSVCQHLLAILHRRSMASAGSMVRFLRRCSHLSGRDTIQRKIMWDMSQMESISLRGLQQNGVNYMQNILTISLCLIKAMNRFGTPFIMSQMQRYGRLEWL